MRTLNIIILLFIIGTIPSFSGVFYKPVINPSPAANWTASGTTNSTLSGSASANNVVATNGVSIPAGSLTIDPVDNTTAMTVAGYALTGANAQSLLDLSTTWNTTGNPSALKLTITDTASGATAEALEILGGAAGTTALFSLTKGGNALFADGTAANPTIGWASDFDGSGTGFYRRSAGALTIANNGVGYHEFGAGYFQVSSGSMIGWSSSVVGSSFDTILLRDAANTLALRNGANAQTFNIYNTYTDAGNYERGVVRWNGNDFQIGTVLSGTGVSRQLDLLVGGSIRWAINTSGHFLAATDNTYDIGASGATRPRNGYFGTSIIAPVITASSGNGIGSSLVCTVDGVGLLRNWNGNDFNRLQFGGTTASFPSLKRSTTNLVARLADDSTDTAFQAAQFIVSGTTNQVIFGATNTAPVDAVTPTKWISVQVIGEATVYRLPLYE